MFLTPQTSFAAFDEQFQLSIIKYIIGDVKFLQSILDSLRIEFFTYMYQQEIIKVILAFYGAYKKSPTLEELTTTITQLEGIFDKEVVLVKLNAIPTLTSYAKDFVVNTTISFFKTQEMIKALNDSKQLLVNGYTQEKFDEIFDKVKKAYVSCQTLDIGHNYKGDAALRYQINNNSLYKIASSGFIELDSMMQGGTDIGEIACIKGGSGIGKTTFLVNIGYHNIASGKNVWHISLELSEKYVGKKYDARHTLIPFDSLQETSDTVLSEISNLPGNIIISRYPEFTLTPERLYLEYDRLLAMGFVPDLLLLDYADLMVLNNKTVVLGSAENSAIMGRIYGKLRTFGEETRMPVWTASQINRDGMKSAGGGQSNTSGSVQKNFFSDMLVEMIMKPEDRINNTAILEIQKNRRGPTGVTIPMKNIDLSTCYYEVDRDNFISNVPQNILDTLNRNESKADYSLANTIKKNKPQYREILSGLRKQYYEKNPGE